MGSLFTYSFDTLYCSAEEIPQDTLFLQKAGSGHRATATGIYSEYSVAEHLFLQESATPN